MRGTNRYFLIHTLTACLRDELCNFKRLRTETPSNLTLLVTTEGVLEPPKVGTYERLNNVLVSLKTANRWLRNKSPKSTNQA